MIWILDFGSQYTRLIARKTRQLGFSCEILTVEEGLSKIAEKPDCLVLSGGPHSVFQDAADYGVFFESDIPVLGICYGMQLMTQHFSGRVEKGQIAEYGRTKVFFHRKIPGLPEEIRVWMGHYDEVAKLPKGFDVLMKSRNDVIAGIINPSKRMMGLQFHPEVEHGEYGLEILKHFYQTAGLKKNWNPSKMLKQAQDLVSSVDGHVLCAFSGGVDSLVSATIAHQLIGERLFCFFVDHGLLRPQDHRHIEILKRETPLNIEVVDSKNDFLKKLEGVGDPERKRKIIGHTFIEVFEDKVHQFERDRGIEFTHLLQGTLYPDVIESVSPNQGRSATIKSHHNVGGLPERMKLELLEPLRFLFKDEVRQMGETLGLKKEWIGRHPFPGPGVGLRVLGKITPESIAKVQASDQILFEELKSSGLYQTVAQALTVLLPVKTVGVKGDGRSYEEVICLRVVNTGDFMTAVWSELPASFLAAVSNRITNEVEGVTRVVYDITSKPPGTIEWE